MTPASPAPRTSSGSTLSGTDASSTAVIGYGNSLCGDDAAGPETVRRLADRVDAAVDLKVFEGDGAALANMLSEYRRVVVVDALLSGDEAGEVAVWDGKALPPHVAGGLGSTHSLGLAQAIELTRMVGRLPEELVVVTITGGEFRVGSRPSHAVLDALETAARRTLELLEDWRREDG